MNLTVLVSGGAFYHLKSNRGIMVLSKDNLPERAVAMEERMNIEERYKYLRMMQPRYRQAGRKEKGRLLSETEEMTSLHRKYVIQLMNGPPPHRKKRRRQRGRKYGAQVDDAIRVIGKALDWVCAERLKPALPKMARHLTKFGELRVTPGLLEQLEQIQTLICTCQHLHCASHCEPGASR